MKSNILNIKGVEVLSKQSQKEVLGQAKGCNLSLCGCDCAGNVTGPSCCNFYIGCPQVYTC